MKNITLKQYSELPDASEYDAVLEHLNPINSFAGKSMDVNKMPYANVKYCIKQLGKVSNWQMVQQLFEICFDADENAFWGAGVIEFYQARKYMIRELERVVTTEYKAMASPNSDEHLWLMAGADRLRPYSDTLPLVNLAKQFGMYPYDLGRKPYGEVFSLMVQVKVQGEVEMEYQKLKK